MKPRSFNPQPQVGVRVRVWRVRARRLAGWLSRGVPESAADPSRGQPARRGEFLPGPAEVLGQRSGKAEAGGHCPPAIAGGVNEGDHGPGRADGAHLDATDSGTSACTVGDPPVNPPTDNFAADNAATNNAAATTPQPTTTPPRRPAPTAGPTTTPAVPLPIPTPSRSSAWRPRFHLHFTQTSSSWPNLVERFFAELTTRLLRRGNCTVTEFEADIRTWIKGWSDNPRT
jgi:hypothetical protein